MYHLAAISLITIFLLESKIKSKRLLNIACLTPFVLVILLRYGVGADYFSYEYIYNFLDISSLGKMIDSMNNVEIGFKSIFYVGRFFNLSYPVVIALISLAMTFIVALFINDKSDNIALSYLLFFACFFFPWSLNAVRQGLAIALALYLMFGNNKFTIKQKYIMLLFLTLFHFSVIIVIPLYYLSTKAIGRKNSAIIIAIAMVMSLIPLNTILGLFENIPFLSKLALYASPSSGLLDFQSIARIVLLLPILFYYDRFEDKVAANFSLLSFALYFALKSNELIAARMSIYGFFMIVILYPTIYTFISFNKKMWVIATTGLVAFSSMFYIKEFNTSFYQANFVGSKSDRNMISIFNKDKHQRFFLNQFNLITQSNNICSVNSADFFNRTNFETVDYSGFVEGDTFETAKFPNGKYGVISQKGDVVIAGVYNTEPIIRGHILTTTAIGSHFTRDVHFDLKTSQEVSFDTVRDTLLEFETMQLELNSNWFDIRELYYEELVDTPLNTLIPVNEFDNLALISFSQPMWYNVVEAAAHSNSFMIFVDNQLRPINDVAYQHVDAYGLSKIARGYTSCGSELINEYGEVIWYE